MNANDSDLVDETPATKSETLPARQAKWIDSPDETSTWWWMYDPSEKEISAARVEWRDERPWTHGKSCWVTWLRTTGGISSESIKRLKDCRFKRLACPQGDDATTAPTLTQNNR